MQATITTFWEPKAGSSEAEYEDSYWTTPDGEGSTELGGSSLHVVVTDGASECLLAGRWAKHLSSTFGSVTGSTDTRKGFLATYSQAVDGWAIERDSYIESREKRGVPIQWYEQPGLDRGAYATLVGLHLMEDSHGTERLWYAAAIGDSCFFQVRNEKLHVSFPLSRADDFSTEPALLPSKAASEETLTRYLRFEQGDWDSEDTFYVVTDALAAWFLRVHASGEKPWEPLRDLDTTGLDEDFRGWVEARRAAGEMRDDDTTLVRIDIH